MKTITTSEARTHFYRIIKEISKSKEPIQITLRGKVIARILPQQPLQERFIGVIGKIKKYRKGAKLDGLTIQQLRDEGRR